ENFDLHRDRVRSGPDEVPLSSAPGWGGRDMAYQSDTIATVVNRLNVRYFLPAIQREFVWKPDQIIQLFDSLLRNYPISTFLFWELKPEHRDKWEIYRFIEHFRQEGTHNEVAATAGVQQLNL